LKNLLQEKNLLSFSISSISTHSSSFSYLFIIKNLPFVFRWLYYTTFSGIVKAYCTIIDILFCAICTKIDLLCFLHCQQKIPDLPYILCKLPARNHITQSL
jgi:hypothetical protein